MEEIEKGTKEEFIEEADKETREECREEREMEIKKVASENKPGKESTKNSIDYGISGKIGRAHV